MTDPPSADCGTDRPTPPGRRPPGPPTPPAAGPLPPPAPGRASEKVLRSRRSGNTGRSAPTTPSGGTKPGRDRSWAGSGIPSAGRKVPGATSFPWQRRGTPPEVEAGVGGGHRGGRSEAGAHRHRFGVPGLGSPDGSPRRQGPLTPGRSSPSSPCRLSPSSPDVRGESGQLAFLPAGRRVDRQARHRRGTPPERVGAGPATRDELAGGEASGPACRAQLGSGVDFQFRCRLRAGPRAPAPGSARRRTRGRHRRAGHWRAWSPSRRGA
jgi:hypothetical protein